MDEFRRKLLALETLYGSQKAAAKKLGVSERTFRAYKSGETTPPKSRVKQANRLVGNRSNKQRLENELRPKLERRERQYEARQNKPKIEATNRWLNAEFGKDLRERYIIHNLNGETPYVAYMPNNHHIVQFTDGLEPTGKPKGTKFITVYGVWAQSYYIDDPAAGNLWSTKIPTLGSISQDWDLAETLAWAERTFMQQPLKQIRNRKFQPVRFIGYKL